VAAVDLARQRTEEYVIVDQPPDPLERLRAELAAIRAKVAGVRGSVIGGVDGLLKFQEGATGQDPNDLAALAAAAYGIGRQTGHVLGFGGHFDTTIHNARGYFGIYSVNDTTLLSFVGEEGLNVARLHLEFRTAAEQIDRAVRTAADALAYHNPRL
jgi:predicted regulator of Ras-like GTPase activity (Roadblock/LC7/MglB family)